MHPAIGRWAWLGATSVEAFRFVIIVSGAGQHLFATRSCDVFSCSGSRSVPGRHEGKNSCKIMVGKMTADPRRVSLLSQRHRNQFNMEDGQGCRTFAHGVSINYFTLSEDAEFYCRTYR